MRNKIALAILFSFAVAGCGPDLGTSGLSEDTDAYETETGGESLPDSSEVCTAEGQIVRVHLEDSGMCSDCTCGLGQFFTVCITPAFDCGESNEF